ncbi:aryl-alcohol dehydrogenase [Neobacillus niacini]|uniref:NAD(P)-dependent alcohol dehydrogenase n=1 Tax=Neobacillus niacini TaxID=86668 RepID=UPI00277E8C9F|nr:NAD(P)-dependent alcohol dehydrogenase [Neobacillus niacini]MDQ1002204.1 aryl-alcohol dehydrogenase [Neobacillus niacini]
MKIKAAVTHNIGEDFKIEEVELSNIKENEVLVKIVAVGVCHTDAVAWQAGISPFPIVLGHEGSGIVEKIGSNVRAVLPGDHVVLSYSSCRECANCLSGHPSTCIRFADLNFRGKMEDGSTRLSQNNHPISTFFGQSSFGTYAIANEKNIVKVEKDIDLALLGPLGCGIQTGSGTVLNKLRPGFGSTIAIFGCGAVGLSAVMAAKIAGCKSIIAIDINDERLNLASEIGATYILNGSKEDVVNEITMLTNGGVDFALETTGVPNVVKKSITALRPHGKCAVVGVTPETTLDINDMVSKSKTLIGVIEGDAIPQLFIPELIAYYKDGRFPFDKLVKYYHFEEINQAFEDSKEGLTIKPILRIN